MIENKERMSLSLNPFNTVLDVSETKIQNKKVDKIWYIHTIEYYSVIKKENKRHCYPATKRWILNINWCWNRPTWKVHTLYDSNYMTYGKDKTIATLNSSMAVGNSGEVRRVEKVKHRIFFIVLTYSLWYCNGECITWCIYQNPWNCTIQIFFLNSMRCVHS